MFKDRVMLAAAAAALVTAGPGFAEPQRAIRRVAAPGAVVAAALPRFAGLRQLRTPALLQNMEKRVMVEGFFYDNGSAAIVVDDLARTRCNMLMPADSYVPVEGAALGALKVGDRVSLSGVIRRPAGALAQKLQGESAVLHVAGPGDISRKGPSVKMEVEPVDFFKPAMVIDWPKIIEGAVIVAAPAKYAVLLAGGANAANNHMRYWNDLKATYKLLLTKGYQAARIYVIYANGVAKDAQMPVNYSASKANVSTVFSALAAKMKASDVLYVQINDHGGGCLTQASNGDLPGLYGGRIDASGDETGDALSEAASNADFNGDGDKNDTVRVDESISLWGDTMWDDEFAVQVNKIQSYKHMIIQMEQCFSGGFVDDLTGPRRVLMAAAKPTEFSWGGASYNPWAYHVISAMGRKRPDTGVVVNADANGNGKVSMVEVHNYARTNDTSGETPQYEDNGVRPCHAGNMPSGGDGALGAGIDL